MNNCLSHSVLLYLTDPGAWELCLVLLSNNNDAAEKNLRRKILALKIVALNKYVTLASCVVNKFSKIALRTDVLGEQ